jgi:deoxyribodipyrimidine photolyase
MLGRAWSTGCNGRKGVLHYHFLLEGFRDAQADLAMRGVTLVLRIGDPTEVVSRLVDEIQPSVVIGDENPVRAGQVQRDRLDRSGHVIERGRRFEDEASQTGPRNSSSIVETTVTSRLAESLRGVSRR